MQAEEDQGGLSPLHACWLALLERMLEANQTDLVLKALDSAQSSGQNDDAQSSAALLTPAEVHRLIDTSRSLAQQGEPTRHHVWL